MGPPGRTLEGARVLLASGGDSRDPPLATLLDRAGATVDAVPEEPRAIDLALAARAEARPYDVVLLDDRPPSVNGASGVARLRGAGYEAGVVALGRRGVVGDRGRSLDIGFDEHVDRPIDPEVLIEALRGHSSWSAVASPDASSARAQPEALASSMSDDPFIQPLLGRFLDEVASREHSLRRALGRSDTAALRRIAHALAGVGGSYGFDLLTDAARRLELSATPSNGDLRALTEDVSLVCRRMLAGRRGRPSGGI
jgi:HPt (histidine-containing phosphotransfer) domain-containing protein